MENVESVVTEKQNKKIYHRPTGRRVFGIGMFAVIAGIILVVLSASGKVDFMWFSISGAMISGGVFLLVIGYIVRAMWFLDGKEEKSE